MSKYTGIENSLKTKKDSIEFRRRFDRHTCVWRSSPVTIFPTARKADDWTFKTGWLDENIFNKKKTKKNFVKFTREVQRVDEYQQH